MNNKGFYNNNKEWAEKVKSFFRESGFYIMIVLGLCILAVGAVYFTTNHLISSPERYEDDLVPDGIQTEIEDDKEYVILDDGIRQYDRISVGEPEDSEAQEDDLFDFGLEDDSDDNYLIAEDTDDLDKEDESDVETTAKPTPMPTVEPKPTEAPDKPAENAQNDDSEEVIKLFGSKPVFVMPVKGKIQMDYAMDRLLYSKTLDEWRTHSGVDIAAPRGDVVKAAADGYIKEIKKDPCYGITITIDHENGYKTIYSNLASDSMVSVNQKVKAGDAISSVGNTAIFECMDPPHLHFEVYRNDKLIDPKTVLPELGDQQ
ncbi:MAG TPA: M23 family peptidase [Ruminiclostridium sp.]|nr:peptidoglycan DD-metalloendopeptidase family protein [Clostridiaceae bacterium]HAA25251.1 M23 family peptidase [Ruminiclostridium sp.]